VTYNLPVQAAQHRLIVETIAYLRERGPATREALTASLFGADARIEEVAAREEAIAARLARVEEQLAFVVAQRTRWRGVLRELRRGGAAGDGPGGAVSVTPLEKSVTRDGESVTRIAKSVTGVPESVTREAKSATPERQGVTPTAGLSGAAQSVTPPDQSVTAADGSVTRAAESVTPPAETVTPEAKSVTPQPMSVTRAPESVTPGTESVTREAKSVTPGAESVTRGPESVTRGDGGGAGAALELLRIERLSKTIGSSDILIDISFDVREGEILGLIGPNGAGKTTLLECLAGLRPRTSGTFFVRGEAPPAWDPRALMFYLPNGVTPYADLYTEEVLRFFGDLYEVAPERWDQVVYRDLSLGPALGKRVSALSKGNMQRVLISLALMAPQPLLALDEPFDGLDLHQTHAMMGILRGLRASGRTLLLCIHQLIDAEAVCDRLVLLAAGRLVGVGTLEELRALSGERGGSLEEIFLALT
jgi:ABC-2 type transport system ATP-binding protein